MAIKKKQKKHCSVKSPIESHITFLIECGQDVLLPNCYNIYYPLIFPPKLEFYCTMPYSSACQNCEKQNFKFFSQCSLLRQLKFEINFKLIKFDFQLDVEFFRISTISQVKLSFLKCECLLHIRQFNLFFPEYKNREE